MPTATYNRKAYRRGRRRGPALTEADAKHFEAGRRESSRARFETLRAARVAAGAHPADCSCEPYDDVFTARRWQALGRRPRKGTKAFADLVWIDDETGAALGDDGAAARTAGRRIRRATAYIFCRCQTCEAGASCAAGEFTYTVPPAMLDDERGRNGDGDTAPKPAPSTRPALGGPLGNVSETRPHVRLPDEWAQQLVYELRPAGRTVKVWAYRTVETQPLEREITAQDGTPSNNRDDEPQAWLTVTLSLDDEEAARLAGNSARVMECFRPLCGVFLYETAHAVAVAAAIDGAGLTGDWQRDTLDIGELDINPTYKPACMVTRLRRLDDQQ